MLHASLRIVYRQTKNQVLSLIIYLSIYKSYSLYRSKLYTCEYTNSHFRMLTILSKDNIESQ